MKIIPTSQANSTEEWLNLRVGKITGTKAAGMAMEPYAYKDPARLLELAEKNETAAEKARTDAKRREYLDKAAKYREQIEDAERLNKRLKTTADFWSFLAELWADAPDGENPAERGHRLENSNAIKVIEKEGLENYDTDTGMWVSSTDERIAVSPDVTEQGDKPSWAIECKSLGTPNHLAAVVPIVAHRLITKGEKIGDLLDAAEHVLPESVWDDDARDYDFIPAKYRNQALQYFVVNPDLSTLYFSFYDPRVYSGFLQHVYLTVDRATVAAEIEEQQQREATVLHISDVFSAAFGAEF